MKTRILLTLAFLIAINLFSFSQVFEKQGAGVTIIVHGWNPDGSQPAWMDKMADAIIARNGGVGKKATITVTGSLGSLTATCSNWTFDLAAETHSELVILVNWTAVSNHLTIRVPAQDVAAAIAPKIYQSQNSQPALSELPIHLIGHSRGGGMVFEIARLLGLQGIEVEQVTALDPHPLTSSDMQPITGNIIDTPIKIYENILFADNYYQNIKYPKGQYITGAYNRLWSSLPGGYHNETGYTYTIGLPPTSYDFSDHLNIILAYHGTIGLETPVTNGQATMTTTERAWFNTFENAAENTGFKYSRIIMGNRKSTDIPVASDDAIIAGYHNNALLGGSGARDVLVWTSAVWNNIITSSIFRSTTELQTGAQTVTASEVLPIKYKYRSYANASVVTFYVDIDRNPYNNNNQSTIGTQNLPLTGSTITESTSTINWTVSGLTSGTKYYVYAKITDATRTRFQYLDNEFSISSSCTGNINIPDANFKNLLLADANINTNGDGEIQCSEAAAFTGEIHAAGANIANMTGIEAFTNATELYCGGNSFTTLNLSSNTALQRLYCGSNSLTNLNLTSNTALVHLECNDGLLTSLNISGLTSLTEIYCQYNQFSTLDFTTNTGLQYLYCYGNLLTSLNVSGLTSLIEIYCYDNQLPALNVSTNTALTSLNCYNNSLTDLDLSANTALTTLSCYSNLLTTLNVTGLSLLKYIDCSKNKFENLNFSDKGLTSLTDIYCNENSLTTFNISGLSALTFIYCSYNQLSSLDCSTNTALENLYCDNNSLTSLNVSGLINLIAIYCHHNQISDLNVSGLTSLNEINCYNNQLTSINLTGLNSLSYIDCSYNQFSSLNFSGLELTSLEYIYCNANLLTNLNVSGLTSLIEIDCYENQITSLDFSTNTAIQYLYCRDNLLTSLNAKNGNNTNMSDFDARNNPDLTCIQVDDAAYSTTNWTNKDATASFNTNCGYNTYTIAASVLPTSSGSVTGTGTYNAGTTVTLTATPATGYTFTNWTESATPVSTDATYSFTATANRTLVANFTQTTAIENIFDNSSITIYPNPNNGRFTVGLNNSYNGEITIIINSVIGNQLKFERVNKFAKEVTYPIEMENLSKGIYIVNLQTSTHKVVKMVIIE